MDQAALDKAHIEFGGKFVVWLGNEVILSADTYDELRDRLDEMPIDQSKVVFDFIRRTDVVYIL
ncbi:MAG: hypothetical protein U0893_06755 [Chloroflexota bacterium]